MLNNKYKPLYDYDYFDGGSKNQIDWWVPFITGAIIGLILGLIIL